MQISETVGLNINRTDLNLIDFKRGEPGKGGTWFYIPQNKVHVAVICCPFCESNGMLDGVAGNHTVAPDGKVNPSVICDCGNFHAFINLLDYKGRELPQ